MLWPLLVVVVEHIFQLLQQPPLRNGLHGATPSEAVVAAGTDSLTSTLHAPSVPRGQLNAFNTAQPSQDRSQQIIETSLASAQSYWRVARWAEGGTKTIKR